MMTPKEYKETSVYKEIEDRLNLDPYRGTVYEELKRLNSKTKGAMFEKLYTEYQESKGLIVEKAENGSTEHDRVLVIQNGPIFWNGAPNGKNANRIKKEIKGSFLWGTGTHFRWQQIRPAHDYDDIVFLAVWPDRIEFYESDKKTVTDFVTQQDEDGNWPYNQHGGKTKNSGTFLLDGFPADFPFMKKI